MSVNGLRGTKHDAPRFNRRGRVCRDIPVFYRLFIECLIMPIMPQFVCNMSEQKISVNGVLVTITKDTINKTCKWFADNIATQLEEVLWGIVKVNSTPDFMEYVSSQYLEYKNGTFYPGLWFWQKAYFIQTGKSISLL